MESVERVIEKMKKSGMKITPQRVMVLKFLEGNKSHPTLDDIYQEALKKFSTVSYATIYNTMEMLKKIGEVKELIVEKGRVHYDPNTHPHSHAYCRICGRIFDVETSIEVPSRIDGFQVEDISICYYGVCKECMEKPKTQ